MAATTGATAEGSVLLIIDVQKGFVREATAHIPAKVEALQAGYATVAATRFFNPPGSPYRRLIGWDRMAPDDGGFPLAFALRAGAPVFDKPFYSAFSAPGFAAWLDGIGAAAIHLCGIATDNCVLKTAADLFEAGRRPVVLAESCASHGGAELHACALKILRRLLGENQVVG